MKTKASFLIVSIACLMALAVSLTTVQVHTLGGGVIRGRIMGYTHLDEVTPLVWARISAYIDGNLIGSVTAGSNGSYLMYVPGGNVNITVEYPGFIMQSKAIYVSEGGATTLDWYLERAEVPIPEFSSYSLLLMVAFLIAFSQVLLRRKIKQT